MADLITLIDLPSQGRCHCWFPAGWKARTVLNFKNIPYKTEWVKYSDLQQTLKSTGVAPNAEGTAIAEFTAPVIKFSDGTALMDSMKIATALEAMRPEPSLHLESDLHLQAAQAVLQIQMPLRDLLMVRICRDVIVPEDVEWFRADRSRRFGTTLQQWEAERGSDDPCNDGWEAAKPGFKLLSELLTKHKKDDGPFILGSTPSFADFVVASSVRMFQEVGDDAFERIVAHDPAIGKLYAACSQWFDRDDY